MRPIFLNAYNMFVRNFHFWRSLSGSRVSHERFPSDELPQAPTLGLPELHVRTIQNKLHSRAKFPGFHLQAYSLEGARWAGRGFYVNGNLNAPSLESKQHMHREASLRTFVGERP